MKKRTNQLFGGVLLVSGTILGAAILAFPVITGMAGFFPSCLLFCIYWMYMTYTALLMLEVNLWESKTSNMVSMARHTLGRGGEIVSWITYLFLLYALITAYVSVGGGIIVTVAKVFAGVEISKWVGILLVIFFFGFFVYEGTYYVDIVNRFLMIGLVITYLIMTALVAPHVELKRVLRHDWHYLPAAISVVLTSFGFQIIIPTLSQYLHRSPTLIKKAIIIGSLIPLIIYVIWQFLMLGVIPIEGEFGIISGFKRGDDAARLLSGVFGSISISAIAAVFSFFAVTTSLLGVSISLLDFLADGLKIKKTRWGKISLFLLTFIPPIFFILTDPRAFLSALEYAGGFGVVILLGLLPTLMAWRGRYYHRYDTKYKAPGGKPALIISMLFSLLIMAFVIGEKLGWIQISTMG